MLFSPKMKLSIALCVNSVLSFKLERLRLYQQTGGEIDSLLNLEKDGHELLVQNQNPFLTRSVMTEINDEFLYDLTKDHDDTHYMSKPDKRFVYLELQHMSVYFELVKLFRDEEQINQAKLI